MARYRNRFAPQFRGTGEQTPPVTRSDEPSVEGPVETRLNRIYNLPNYTETIRSLSDNEIRTIVVEDRLRRLTYETGPETLLKVQREGSTEVVVEIKTDGTVNVPNGTVEDAAREFWRAVERINPYRPRYAYPRYEWNTNYITRATQVNYTTRPNMITWDDYLGRLQVDNTARFVQEGEDLPDAD